ncbi:M61 family metallopeptidase [Terriglobus aquaticus]|uniref:M61 family metallopeptidase n=1 Tax=Terriglobus aquaticus TaxID=940139 RepID=UPI0021E0BF98|nr:M61 family peptidase [Terriglobus aquaticus]
MPHLKTAVALAATLLLACAAPLASAQTPIQITADLTEGYRHLYHAEIDLPVKAGPATFITPRWIPGTHAPGGPLADITGVVFTANGQTLAWRRDDVNLAEFHVEIPRGVTSIHVHLDSITSNRVTRNMSVLEWERLMLYPANVPVKNIAIQPSVTVPAGWGTGTALKPVGTIPTPPTTGVNEDAHRPQASAVTTKYAVTNVEQLEDSPVITGKYFHEYTLAPEIKPAHFLDVVSDSPNDVNLRPKTLNAINNLVREADANYASHHYFEYHFLLTLSDVAGGEGLEHGQSSDNGVGEKGFSDDAHQLAEADLLAHEFTHSWNGKYRRPARLYQPDFATPQQGDLMWVYEGMTQYWGNVLAARAGLKTQAQYRDLLAASAAQLDYKAGRDWRPTEDTAVAGSLIRGGNSEWVNWRRGQDYYQEGELVWLDADTTIRKLTNNQKSLDDFVKIFLGKGGNTGPLIVGYEFPELVADLNQVVPYDWAKFLSDRIRSINVRADLEGIDQGGYKLVYQDKPSASEKLMEEAHGRRTAGTNVWYSLGMRLNERGQIGDVRYGGPSDQAKLAPSMTLLAVNGKPYSGDTLREAIRASKTDTNPIHLLVQQEDAVFPIDIDYHDGERFPVMVRVEGTSDYLDDITKPRTTAPAGSQQ